eukprot:CAMPEP_0181302856 /NCGR_PEP_ID=MMETSP1101-20121128/8225_1 /TAXON_ID=46948 /ORGANISM="Rhodomonas abbreviata, Strain Caron Lab Isolate" /LENGTH=122 /DNA_ID=CAMNT_0023408345 /DNA_START=869 /DNA_END=1238 /DNA_ORIENTATION=+
MYAFFGQIAFAAGIIGIALVVCCALIATSELKAKKTVLYGLGSGEEQEGANAIATTFATFDGQDEMIEELLGEEYYVPLFEEIAEDEKTVEAIDEVKIAIDEAKNEHKILEEFANGADAPLE